MSDPYKQAFYGAEFVRTEVLDGLASGDQPGMLMRLWLAPRSGHLALDMMAAEYGLDAALIRLVASLGGDPLDTDVQHFVKTVVQSLPVGAAIDNLVSDWLVWTWDHGADHGTDHGAAGLSSRLAGTTMEASARKVVDLIIRNRESAVAAPEFRSARNDVRQHSAEQPALQPYGEIVQAMAWDAKRMPGVISDVISAWHSALRQDSFASSGWTDAMEAEFDALQSRIFDKAAAEVKALGLTDQQELVSRLRAVQEAGWQASGKLELRERNQQCRFAANLHIREWTETARKALLHIIAQAS